MIEPQAIFSTNRIALGKKRLARLNQQTFSLCIVLAARKISRAKAAAVLTEAQQHNDQLVHAVRHGPRLSSQLVGVSDLKWSHNVQNIRL
ncbi:MAG: hypothetical protein NVS2B7_40570 [Herpetosiphon sp.]